MNIEDVLARKGRRVVTVRPTKRVAELPALLDDNGISSVVVVDTAGQPLGILTDRIFIQNLARRGPDLMQLTMADIMQTPVPTCGRDDSLTTALRAMTEHRERHLVVVEDRKIAGIVSIGDLVKFRIEDAELESRVLREMALGHIAAQAS